MNRRRLLIGLAIASLAPYLVLGPGLFLDDWFALRGASLEGWWRAAGDDQWAARPGAGVVYAVAFGLIGARPLVLALVAAGLTTVAALKIATLGARVFDGRVATAIAAVWLVTPNHTSLETWPSALNILLALVCMLTGFEWLTRDSLGYPIGAAAAVLLAAGTLSYEAVLPATIAGLLLVYFRQNEPTARRMSLVGLGLQLLAGGWMLANWHPAKSGLQPWLRPERLVDGHLGTSVFGADTAGRLLSVAVLGLLAAVCGRRIVRGRWCDPRTPPLAGIGSVLIVLGALPFLRYFYAPVGFGDRVMVVSSLGGACILVGLAIELRALIPQPSIVVFAVLALGAIHWRVEMISRYATAADDGRRVLAAVEARFPDPPEATLVFGPTPVVDQNVVAFLDMTWPIAWLYGTPEVEATLTFHEDDFFEAPTKYRFDLHELSNLEATQDP